MYGVKSSSNGDTCVDITILYIMYSVVYVLISHLKLQRRQLVQHLMFVSKDKCENCYGTTNRTTNTTNRCSAASNTSESTKK
jgi:hypothetical protein